MATNAEILLALRDPGADWLATLITALDESSRDSEFTPRLRALFADLASREQIPDSIVAAAHRRTTEFTAELTREPFGCDSTPPPRERPRLTLVAG